MNMLLVRTSNFNLQDNKLKENKVPNNQSNTMKYIIIFSSLIIMGSLIYLCRNKEKENIEKDLQDILDIFSDQDFQKENYLLYTFQNKENHMLNTIKTNYKKPEVKKIINQIKNKGYDDNHQKLFILVILLHDIPYDIDTYDIDKLSKKLQTLKSKYMLYIKMRFLDHGLSHVMLDFIDYILFDMDDNNDDDFKKQITKIIEKVTNNDDTFENMGDKTFKQVLSSLS